MSVEWKPYYRNDEFDLDYLTQELVRIRNWNADQIPEQIVHSSDLEDRLKVRTAWLIGLASLLETAVDENLLNNSQVKEGINKFLEWYVNDWGSKRGVGNTREDIEKGNEIIEKVLESIPVKPVVLGKLE